MKRSGHAPLESKPTKPSTKIWEVRESEYKAISDNNFAELNNSVELVELVLHEIQKIESVEIKDQAYFDLLLYSLDNRMYSRAVNAIMSIENTTFRDTARGEYALVLIKDGQVRAAFEILDSVETDDLRDVLQLKAIQSMIGPENQK